MKLELKHLAPYLPYNLKCTNSKDSYLQTGEDRTGILETLSIKDNDTVIMGSDGYFLVSFFEVVPLLRPLSDLTKEIEHNGERFVPIYKLFELEYKGTAHYSEKMRGQYFNQLGRFIECSHYGTAATTSVNIINLGNNNHWKMQKLHEWHFDTNSLIEKGLAIDINTL